MLQFLKMNVNSGTLRDQKQHFKKEWEFLEIFIFIFYIWKL